MKIDMLAKDDPSILLSSGNYFYFKRPRESNFDISDIAAGLSKICRFNGQCHSFYSVAQHSILVSQIVPKKHALAALLHDAAEAFIGDMVAPLKGLFPEYKALEHEIEAVIFERFGIPTPLDPCIKEADLILLKTEQRDLMSNRDAWSQLENIHPLPETIIPYALPRRAYFEYLTRYYEIKGVYKDVRPPVQR